MKTEEQSLASQHGAADADAGRVLLAGNPCGMQLVVREPVADLRGVSFLKGHMYPTGTSYRFAYDCRSSLRKLRLKMLPPDYRDCPESYMMTALGSYYIRDFVHVQARHRCESLLQSVLKVFPAVGFVGLGGYKSGQALGRFRLR